MTKGKTKAAKPLFSMYIDMPSQDQVAAKIAAQLLAAPLFKERVERRAAECIDATISKIVTDKATPIIESGERFDFKAFVHSRVSEWGQRQMLDIVERLVAREHERAMLTVTKDVEKLAKATIAVMAARQSTVVPKLSLVRRKRRKRGAKT